MEDTDVLPVAIATTIAEPTCVQIRAAEPCNSVSTGLQCEMDPVSQTQAGDVLSSLGFSVVGWYHSHPTFHPNPSVRDINTQDQFQVKETQQGEVTSSVSLDFHCCYCSRVTSHAAAPPSLG